MWIEMPLVMFGLVMLFVSLVGAAVHSEWVHRHNDGPRFLKIPRREK